MYVCVYIYIYITVRLPWRTQWHPTPVLLPGKSHGRRNMVGCNPWGRYELDMTERLHFHFSLSRIGEGNGNPLQCSCLENPRDEGGEPGGLPSMGLHRVRHDWHDLAAAAEEEKSPSISHFVPSHMTIWSIVHLCKGIVKVTRWQALFFLSTARGKWGTEKYLAPR